MAVDNNKVYYCERCNRTMGADQFYTSNNLEKYPMMENSLNVKNASQCLQIIGTQKLICGFCKKLMYLTFQMSGVNY